MSKKQCECCLSFTEDEMVDATSESADLVSLCFSIQILSHSSDNSIISICNMCGEKIKNCNEFRCQILDSQTKLNEIHGFVTPKVEPNEQDYICDIFPKVEVFTDFEDSIEPEFSDRNRSRNKNNEADKDDVEMESDRSVERTGKRILRKKISGIKKCSTVKSPRGMTAKEQKNYDDCLQYISNKNTLDCGICDAKFNSHKLLIFHMAVHYPNFTCTTCGKSFLLKSYLHRHIKTHEEKTTTNVTCTICNKDMASTNLRKHMKTHSGCKQSFPCSICAENLSSHIQRIKHMELVHNRDTYKHQCNFCSKKFYRLDVFNKHIQRYHETMSSTTAKEETNTAIKKAKIGIDIDKDEQNCKVCGEKFLTHKSLMAHLADHYPNFVCDTCGKAFVLQQQLASHVKIHKAEEVTCTVCKKVLKSYYLPVHMERHSGKTKRTKCPHCGERFETHSLRLRHMKKTHNIDIDKHCCSFCPKKFYMLSYLKKHVRRCHFKEHTISCDICDKGFFTTGELKDHIVTHTGEKNFTCDVCSKSYTKRWSLVLHMRTHGDSVEKYECLECDKKFTQRGSLNIHMKNMH